MIFLPLLLQVTAPAEPPDARFERCAAIAGNDQAAGEAAASAWRLNGGGFLAQQCLGIAYTTGGNYSGGAAAFESAARGAELAKDKRVADTWAQAGNAWLAAREPAKARRALDAAIAGGTLTGLAQGEAYLDRARARVALDDTAGARSDIDRALTTAGDDPLAWLLSATLARRMNDQPRAGKDIAEAVKRSPDDASVQLEAGNIAARKGDETAARTAWGRAVELGRDGPVAASAKAALAQFDAAGK